MLKRSKKNCSRYKTLKDMAGHALNSVRFLIFSGNNERLICFDIISDFSILV